MRYATFEEAGWHDWHQVLAHDQTHTIHGTVKLTTMALPYLDRRRLWLRLPSSYFHTDRSYPLLLMLDGQNLFDTATSYSGSEWRVDETMLALEREGIEAIVVGIDNAGKDRAREYLPWAQRTLAPAFLAFLADTLLPHVRASARVLPGQEHTFIAGSSYGGCFAPWAFFARPDSFGGFAAFSPSTRNGRLAEELVTWPYAPGRIYLDHGDIARADSGCSARPIYQLLRDNGYRDGRELLFHPIEHPDQWHHERAWASRFPTAARFLLVT